MTTTRLASQLAAAQLMLVFREGLVGSDRTQGVLCPVPQPNRKSTDRQEQFPTEKGRTLGVLLGSFDPVGGVLYSVSSPPVAPNLT